MKTSELKKLAGVFFALTIGFSPVFGQGWRNGKNMVNLQNYPCTQVISGLSDEQKTKITNLEASHQETMAALRKERQSTTDVIEKYDIRGEMLKKVFAHRKEVRNLLTEEQQTEYDMLHSGGNFYRNQPRGNAFRGNQAFRGNRGYAPGYNCRCQGNGYGFRNRPGNFRGCPIANP